MKADKNKIIKAAINLGVIAVTLLLLVIAIKSVLPGFIEELANGSREDIENYLAGFHDFEGYAIAFLLQFVQIITIFLPSVPIQLAVGVIFGVWRGFLVCYCGYIAASALVFLLSRVLGDKLDKVFPKRSAEIAEIQKKKKRMIIAAEHPAFMVFLASILPILPNGFIPYIAAKTKMKFSSFLLAVAVGCVPTILTLCTVGNQFGNRITAGKWWMALLYTIPLLVLVAIMFWQQKNIIKLYSRLADRLKKKRKNKCRGKDRNCSRAAVCKETKLPCSNCNKTDFPCDGQ